MKQKTKFWLGVAIAILAALSLVQGSYLNDRTIPFSIILLIIGISLIATSKKK